MRQLLGRRVRTVAIVRLGVAAFSILAGRVTAQAPQGAVSKTAKAPKPYTPPPIFMATQPMQITLVAPYRQLKKDRSGTATYRPAEITYVGDSGAVRVPLKVRTRGIWRRKNCDIPPLRLNFSKDSTKKTVFRHIDNVRLVMHCRDNDDYEQYVLQEYQLYRVQRLITQFSMDARLVRVTYVDAEKKDTLATRYAYFLESEPSFAERVGGKIIALKGAVGDDLDPVENARFGVWQYFLGNTDFSVFALHNVALLQRDTSYFPVAYDYDWSGAVNARYAGPAAQLTNKIHRVTDRLMRGYCTDARNYDKAFALFREKKDSIYALYRDSLGAMLRPNVVSNTLKFYDQFYEVINDPRSAKRQVVEACLGGGS